MPDDKPLRDIYHKAYANIVAYLVEGNVENLHGYEDEMTKHLKPVLDIIDKKLRRAHPHVSIKNALVQSNSLHPQINARLRIPWKMSKKNIANTENLPRGLANPRFCVCFLIGRLTY